MTSVGGLVLLDSLPDEFFAHSLRNVLFASWPQLTKLEGVVRLTEVRRRFMEECPEGMSLIQIPWQAGLPDEETRAAMVEMMRRHSERLRCVAVLTMASGFEASRLRSVVTRMRAIEAPGVLTMRFHSSIDGVVEWLPPEHARQTGVQLSPAVLRAALTRLADPKLLA